MASLHYALIEENQRFKLLATYLDNNKAHNTLVLFATEPQIEFFESVFANLLPKVRPNFALLGSALDLEAYEHVVLMDIPNTFEALSQIAGGMSQGSKLILFVFKGNRGYVKMVGKKLSLQMTELSFNPHKFLMVEDKFLELVDSNYAINRQAFYAYGSFLQYFNGHLLKRIFRTDRLNVKNVGLGFGMPIPPKVNLEAKFLTQKAQNKQKAVKRKQKLERVREKLKQEKQEKEEETRPKKQAIQKEVKPEKAPKTKRIQKVKQTKASV